MGTLSFLSQALQLSLLLDLRPQNAVEPVQQGLSLLLTIDPFPGQEVLMALHSQLHQVLPVRKHLVKDPAPGASPGPARLLRQAGAAEVVSALAAGLLPSDEAEHMS